MITLTRQQARVFLLRRHGLLGLHRFVGKEGALQFVRQCGCIQFDPVDVCGKNAELTLQSRVKGFTKSMLAELLYQDRALVDYPDKQLSIMPVEDWPCFARYRQAAIDGGRQFEGLAELEAFARDYMLKNGPVSSDELPIQGQIHWHSMIHWSGNWHGESNAARSVLEQMYSAGTCVIHHKKGARKVYDLAEKHIAPEILHASDPYPDEESHLRFRILRRMGAVGLLWNRPSDAWLNIWGLTAENRTMAFETLEQEKRILPVQVEGIRGKMYMHAEDEALLEETLQTVYAPRCELIAPLDPLLWDRKLIRALFDYHYSWEIYTPQEKRKFGYYVLPMVYGDRFIGRAEAVADDKNSVLHVKNVWLEPGVKRTKGLGQKIEGCMKRLSRFNHCKEVCYEKTREQGSL